MKRPRCVLLLAGLSITACRTATPAAPAPLAAPAAQSPRSTPAPVLPVGLDLSAMDPSVSPCDDFYQYTCGGWLRAAEIPKDRSSWSRGMDTMTERNEKLLRDILEAIAQGKPPPGTPVEPDLGSFYRACMDEPALEKGKGELEAQLKKVAQVKDATSVARQIGAMHRQGLNPLFSFASTQDLGDATQVIGEVDQGGLGLPERDYYTREDAASGVLREKYVAHVQKMFELLGRTPVEAARIAARVMALETELAKASLTLVERRDPHHLYHRIDRSGLAAAAPGFPWRAFFPVTRAPSIEALNVTHPPFFARVSELMKTEAPETWRAYLSWVWIRSTVIALPAAFQAQDFHFRSDAFSGAKEDRPRWKKCVALTNRELGEALAQPFVANHFGPEGKERALAMIEEIEKAFDRELDTLTWMDGPTRERARQKLRAFVKKVGYPDRWRSYKGLQLKGASLFTQYLRTSAFEEARVLAKMGKPLDRSEWWLTPPTVNAYYNPPLNEIVFPAGILQPPFFNQDAPDAVNFGAIGMIVGHEVTHGFDDEGRQYDALGNLTDWWTPASDRAFRERAQCIERQYSAETAIDDLKVNGALTLGENTADLGGVRLTLSALRSWQTRHPAPDTGSTLTAEQQLFVAFGQAWCTQRRPQLARLLTQIDPHSPPRLRVNGPLENLPDFQHAFSCTPKSKMVRPQRCEVW